MVIKIKLVTIYKITKKTNQRGNDERTIESSRSSGTQAGVNDGGERCSTAITEWDHSGTGAKSGGEESQGTETTYHGSLIIILFPAPILA